MIDLAGVQREKIKFRIKGKCIKIYQYQYASKFIFIFIKKMCN